MKNNCTLAREKMRVLEGTASSFSRSWVSDHGFLSGSRGTKPSTDGWHILKAFCILSSNVRPIAITWMQRKKTHDGIIGLPERWVTEWAVKCLAPPLLHSSWHCLFHETCRESGRGPSEESWWRCSLNWAQSRLWSSLIQHSWSQAGGFPEPA